MILHVTNGDEAGSRLKGLFPADHVLSWADILYEGPAPPGLSLEAFSDVRARHLASAGYGQYVRIRQQFRERDRIAMNAVRFREVILWFEHDLTDLLQLFQIVDHFTNGHFVGPLSLAQANTYLTSLPPNAFVVIQNTRKVLDSRRRAPYISAWKAFTDPDPNALIPHLDQFPGLLRLCEESPWTTDGLTRTERVVRQLRAEGYTERWDLFREYMRTEEARFMTDLSFVRVLKGERLRTLPWRWDPEARRFVPAP